MNSHSYPNKWRNIPWRSELSQGRHFDKQPKILILRLQRRIKVVLGRNKTKMCYSQGWKKNRCKVFRISGFITSAQKVTLLSSLVSLSAGLRRTTQMSLTKFDENDVAHGNRKKHVRYILVVILLMLHYRLVGTLGLGYGYSYNYVRPSNTVRQSVFLLFCSCYADELSSRPTWYITSDFDRRPIPLNHSLRPRRHYCTSTIKEDARNFVIGLLYKDTYVLVLILFSFPAFMSCLAE